MHNQAKNDIEKIIDNNFERKPHFNTNDILKN